MSEKEKPRVYSMTCPKCESKITITVPPSTVGEINVKCPKCDSIYPAKLSGVEDV